MSGERVGQCMLGSFRPTRLGNVLSRNYFFYLHVVMRSSVFLLENGFWWCRGHGNAIADLGGTFQFQSSLFLENERLVPNRRNNCCFCRVAFTLSSCFGRFVTLTTIWLLCGVDTRATALGRFMASTLRNLTRTDVARTLRIFGLFLR